MRVAFGDIMNVDRLLTSTPDRLAKAGGKPADVQTSRQAIVTTVKGGCGRVRD